MSAGHKIPVSVLVVIHTPTLDVLLIERTQAPDFWQSVTGSLDREDEAFIETCVREVREETGFDASALRFIDWHKQNRYEIFARWRHRYAPGVTHNVEHVFSLEVPTVFTPVLAPEEHRAYVWLPWKDAAAKCFSWSNRDAILELPARVGR